MAEVIAATVLGLIVGAVTVCIIIRDKQKAQNQIRQIVEQTRDTQTREKIKALECELDSYKQLLRERSEQPDIAQQIELQLSNMLRYSGSDKGQVRIDERR